MRKAKIAVMVSGGGTNLQALIDAEKSGIIKSGTIVLVISNNPDAYALHRADEAGIKSVTITKRDCGSQSAFETAIDAALIDAGAELVVLAGFMSILSESFTKKYDKRIINVHPSLIPSFCGQGFYGLHVHEAVLASGVKLTGATVHFVTEDCDAGPIIAQKAVPVLNGDTPESLQRRVMEECEWKILPEAVSLFCQGKIKITGNKTEII